MKNIWSYDGEQYLCHSCISIFNGEEPSVNNFQKTCPNCGVEFTHGNSYSDGCIYKEGEVITIEEVGECVGGSFSLGTLRSIGV